MMAEMLYFTPGGARITGPPPTSGNYISRREDDPRALINQIDVSQLPPVYRQMAEQAQQSRDTQRIAGMPWYGADTPGRIGTSEAELQQAYDSLSDADKVRVRYLGPSAMLQLAGMRQGPAPGSGFGGQSPYDPTPIIDRPTQPPGAPTSPFDPSYDPLPPPAVLPPENPAVPPAPPAPSWVNQTPSSPPVVTPPAPMAPPPAAPAAPAAPPVPAAPPIAQLPAPVPSGGPDVGPGPYPPVLGGQATWGNPTDPYLMPFSPGSILPSGQGGNPPAWWNEIRQPQQIAPPMWPTTARNPYLGNAGGFNIGTPYFAPMSSWGFYPMAHMSQHMPGSFGMATPGMGSWFTGAPVGFNSSLGAATSVRPPVAPSNAPNPVTANMPQAQNTPMGFGSQTGYGFTPNMAGSMQASTRPSWMTSGMYLG